METIYDEKMNITSVAIRHYFSCNLWFQRQVFENRKSFTRNRKSFTVNRKSFTENRKTFTKNRKSFTETCLNRSNFNGSETPTIYNNILTIYNNIYKHTSCSKDKRLKMCSFTTLNKEESVKPAKVKYKNPLAELSLGSLTAKERDLFMSLCSRMKDLGTEEIVLSFAEIRKLASYKACSNKILSKDLCSMVDKLTNLKLFTDDGKGEYSAFVLFPTFRISTKNAKLTVSVNQDFAFLINNVKDNFTEFELAEHTSLKSAYSKECYRQMKRFKDTGAWWVDIDDFRLLLGIPEKYRDADIKAHVLPQISKELSSIFEQFTISIRYEKKKISQLAFMFERENPTRKEISTDTKVEAPRIEEAAEAQTGLDGVVEKWNAVLGNTAVPKVRGLNKNSTRYKHLNARIQEHGLNTVMEAIDRIAESDFLTGNNKNHWTVTFDWFVNATNFIKIIEGNYDNKDRQIERQRQDIINRNEELLFEQLRREEELRKGNK